jgi:hypothetical protein
MTPGSLIERERLIKKPVVVECQPAKIFRVPHGLKPLQWVPIARQLLQQPRHVRDRRSCRKGDVTPYEFAVQIGCIALSMSAFAAYRHGRNFSSGGKAIDREMATNGFYWEDLKRHRENMTREELKDKDSNKLDKGKSLRSSGAIGYKIAKRKIRPPDVISIECSRSQILRFGTLWCDGSNLTNLDDALDRLCEHVGIMESPLVSWKELCNGHLRLNFNARQWLPTKAYGQVPTFLPIRSPAATSLLLLSITIATQRTARVRQKMPFKKLCELIGIPTKYGGARAQRLFDRALDVLNVHLDKNRDQIAELNEQGVKVPSHVKITGTGHHHVRLMIRLSKGA